MSLRDTHAAALYLKAANSVYIIHTGTMKLSESIAESSDRIHIRAPFPLGTEPLSSTANAFVRPAGGLTEIVNIT